MDTEATAFSNTSGIKYYLHKKPTKNGHTYFFSRSLNKEYVINEVPTGYEIYEHPTSTQLFCRRPLPKVVPNEDIELLNKALEKYTDVESFKINTKKAILSIYITTKVYNQYEEAMRFIYDRKNQSYTVQRYCYKGSVDDWIDVGHGPRAELESLCQKFLPHLGKESYYELH